MKHNLQTLTLLAFIAPASLALAASIAPISSSATPPPSSTTQETAHTSAQKTTQSQSVKSRHSAPQPSVRREKPAPVK